MVKQWKQWQSLFFGGSKITADGDCNHEIKRHLLFGRKAMTNLIVVWLLSCVWLFESPWTVAHQASLSFTISWSLLKLVSIESVMPSNHLIFCHPLLYAVKMHLKTCTRMFIIHSTPKLEDIQMSISHWIVTYPHNEISCSNENE